MKQEQFETDFFPSGATVIVDANELQELIRAKKDLERTNEKAFKLNNHLQDTLDFMKSKERTRKLDEKLKQPIRVKLDIKG